MKMESHSGFDMIHIIGRDSVNVVVHICEEAVFRDVRNSFIVTIPNTVMNACILQVD